MVQPVSNEIAMIDAGAMGLAPSEASATAPLDFILILLNRSGGTGSEEPR